MKKSNAPHIKVKPHTSLQTKAQEEFGKIPLKKFFVASLVLNGLSIGCVMLFRNNLPPELPLFYGVPRGSEQLIQTYGLIIPNLVSLSITIINIILSVLIKNDYLQKVLIIAAFTTALLAAISTFKISLLVGSFW